MDRIDEAIGKRRDPIEFHEVVLNLPDEIVVARHAKLSLLSRRASASTASRRYFNA